MVRLAAAVVFTALLGSGVAAQSDGFCEHLLDLARLASSDFAQLRGERDRSYGDSTYYTSLKALPGADDCEIVVDREYSETTFRCTWRITDDSSLARQYDQFVTAIPRCFPNARINAEPERPSTVIPGTIRPTIVRYMVDSRTTILVREWTSTTGSSRPRIAFSLVHR